MDGKRIEIEVLNTTQDYRRVLLHTSLKKLFVAGILYFLIVTPMLWLAFFGAGADPFDGKSNSVLVVMLLFALLPILLVAGIYSNIWRQAKAIEKTLESAKFVFSENGLETNSKSTSTKVTWDAFQKVQELKEDFLFYPQKNIFYTIPKRSFLNDLQIEDFRSLVREKLGKNAKLNK
jgi:predicted PurR-regulated permease PerM